MIDLSRAIVCKQSKEQFIKNIKYHASELSARLDDFHYSETMNHHPVELDPELDKLQILACEYESKMYETAVELSKLCKKKLEEAGIK